MSDRLGIVEIRSALSRVAGALEVEVGVDRAGVITSIGASCHDLLGWRSEDLIGTPLTRIIPERFHETHRAGFRRFIESDRLTRAHRPIRLPAVHAVMGEIDIELELSRPDAERADVVVIGTLRARRDVDGSAHAELVRVIQQAVGADLPLARLLQDCLAVAAKHHGWVAGAVWWIDPWLDRLRAATVWESEPGAHPGYVAETSAAVLRRGEGIAGHVWSSGVPTFHSDLAGEPLLVRDVAIVGDGLRRGLFFPLTAGGVTVGVVEMLDHEPRPFSLEDQETVWILADELGRHVADRLRSEQQTMQHQRVQTALDAGGMGVWSYHLDTGLVTWDERLEAIYGLEPGSFGGTFEDYTGKIHADDRAQAVERIMAALEHRERFEYQYRATRPDGSIIWLQGAGAPVSDSAGTLQALTGVCFDVTGRMEAQRRLDEQSRHAALAAEVGRTLVGTEPLADRLTGTVEAVVEHLDAAFARIWTLESGDDVLRLAASAGLYTHLDGEHSRIRVGEFKIGTIASTRRSHLVNDVQRDPLIADHAWAEREGIVAFAGYPLVVGDRVVGVLAIFARRRLPRSTMASLASIADTVALAILQAEALVELQASIEESRGHAAAMEVAMRDRAHVAEVLQRSLLPPSLPEVPGIQLAATYRAGIEEVGGDFYDVLPLHRSWGFMIGDVCGRGPEAARLTALARHSLRTALLLGLPPSGALAALNAGILAEDTMRRFCTAVCGTIQRDDDGVYLDLSLGGHPPPLVVGPGGVRDVGPGGPLLGVLAEPGHKTISIRLDPGETLVLYTDGVTEARRHGAFFGEDRLRAVLGSLVDPSPESVVAAIETELDAFVTSRTDDVAVLTIGIASPHSAT